MAWHIATCYEGTENRCEERIVANYGFDTVVLTGVRTKCPRRTWPEMTIEDYAVIPGYVFIEFTHYNFAWDVFRAKTRVTGFLPGADGTLYTVSDSDIFELHRRQAAGEFSDWRSRAIQYFKTRIGSQVQLPKDHRFGGVHVTVKNIVGDNLHWHFELFGHETSGVIKLAKLWPKDDIAREHAATITLSEGLKLYLAKHPDQEEKSLNLPKPPIPV